MGKKMKIEIPEWAEGSFIKVLADTELVAYKEPGKDQPIYVKETRCNKCGCCCLSVGDSSPFGADEEGKCVKLIKEGDEWLCQAGSSLPLCCIMPPKKRNAPECVITFKEQV